MFAALVGASVGFALGVAEWIGIYAFGRASKAAALGTLFGMVGGVLGGITAQYVYGLLSINYLIQGTAQLLLRGVGWSIMGLFFGLGQASITSNPKKMRNGIIGGALGGFFSAA